MSVHHHLGRKATMVLAGMFLLTAAVVLGQWGSPSYASVFPAYVTGIVSLVGILCVGHAATDIASMRRAPPPPQEDHP